MSHQSDLIEKDINAYLEAQEHKSMLRFITCGSVDDGKSTLIGRLLWDSKLIYEDHLSALERDSKKQGTQGGEIDFALLLDGLQAEREQGITIDVAYRFFSTDKRKFIVADTPGHEQYTRNMVTGASTAAVAVILVDARKGILTQTRRHSYLVSLMGIRHVVVAINKMDLVGYDEKIFHQIQKDYIQFAGNLGFEDMTMIPLSALKGDNVIEKSALTNWYQGPTLLGYLESVDVDDKSKDLPFRMPVQLVSRPNQNFRGYCGSVASGQVCVGDQLIVASSGEEIQVEKIVTHEGFLSQAVARQAITLTLNREVDISRGDVLSSARHRPDYADQFEAKIIWMNEDHLLPGRSYLLKMGTKIVPAQISSLKYKINVNTLEHLPAKTLEMNEVGVCNLATTEPVAFDSYHQNRSTGSFILIDRMNNATVGAGLINFALRRAKNIHWQALDVTKEARSEQKGQKPRVLWFTGLSGSGKSAIANIVEKKLLAMGKHTYLLDGDNVRHGLNKDLGFTDADRVENIRRIAELSKLFVDAGLIVLVSFISPYRSERKLAREILKQGEFVEIYVNTPLEICEKRDPKGLYKKARAGELKNFTGIDSSYEVPLKPELILKGAEFSPEQLADQVIHLILSK